jgi:hypothetical protein
MAIVRGGVSVSAVFLVVAIVLFILAGLDQHFGAVNAINLAEFGLASFAASFLV